MNKSRIINIGVALLLVIFLGLTAFSITGYKQQAVFDYNQVKGHVETISSEPHSIIDLEAHARVVNYLTTTIEASGAVKQDSINSPSYLVQEQIHSAKINDGTFMTHQLTNILVHIPASNPSGNALLIMAHYDSVPMGSGASDDAVGIAVMLEAIKYLIANGNEGINDYIFAFVDGEEYGLYGSEVYINSFKGFNDVVSRTKFAVNLESRGTDGTLIMFETSKNNYNAIALFSKLNSHIFTSSIANLVYQSMPNGTDYSNLKDYYQGLNVANLGGGANYHTQNDNYSKIGDSYLTQQMNFVYNIITKTNELNLDTLDANADAVFFSYVDSVVYYPGFVAVIFGIILVLLLGYVIFLTKQKKLISGKQLAKGFALLAAVIVIGMITGFIVYYLLSFLAVLFNVIDASQIGKISFVNNMLLVLFVITILIVTAFVIKLANNLFKVSSVALNYAYTYFISFISIILAFVLPEVSYLFLFIALPSLILIILKAHFANHPWLFKVKFNWLIFIVNLPIIIPVIFLAAYALGASMAYVLAVVVILLGLSLFDGSGLDLTIIFNGAKNLRTKRVVLRFVIVLVLLLIPLTVAVSSRDSISVNLTGKQGLSTYPYDDAIILYQDLDTNNSYLRVYDLNAYPLIKPSLNNLAFNSTLGAYQGAVSLTDPILTNANISINNHQVRVDYLNQDGYYQIKVLNPDPNLTATIIYDDFSEIVTVNDFSSTLRFVRSCQIIFDSPSDQIEIEYTYVIIDANLWGLTIFSEINKIDNLKINYHQSKTYQLTK